MPSGGRDSEAEMGRREGPSYAKTGQFCSRQWRESGDGKVTDVGKMLACLKTEMTSWLENSKRGD